MSVRIVRTRNGEDIICDLFEVTTKDEPEKTVAFQLNHPYNVWLEGVDEPQLLIETDAEEGVQKISEPEINFRPWVPLAAKQHVIVRADEVVTAYDPLPEVITKYNELVEATDGRVTGEIDPVEDKA